MAPYFVNACVTYGTYQASVAAQALNLLLHVKFWLCFKEQPSLGNCIVVQCTVAFLSAWRNPMLLPISLSCMQTEQWEQWTEQWEQWA